MRGLKGEKMIRGSEIPLSDKDLDEGLAVKLALSVPMLTPPADLEDRIMARAANNTVPIPPRHITRLLRRSALLAAILVVGILAGAVLVRWSGSSQSIVAANQPQLLTLVVVGTATAPSSYGIIVLDPVDSEGVFAVRGLTTLTGAQRYQLWLVRADQRRSAGIFTVNGDGYGSLMLRVPPDFKNFRNLEVTREPHANNFIPSGPVIMQGKL